MANFEIIATLKAVKDSENFKALEVRDFESGWQNTKYRFNAISGNNRFMLEISGGKWVDDKKNQILTFSRAEAGKKPEKMTVKWEDRRSQEMINKVAGYNIYYTTDNTTPTASSSKISFASTDKSGSKIITLNSIPSRGS